MVPKRGPNRIFDAEALRKPLGALLERSWTLLEPKKLTWNRSWAVLGRSWTPISPYIINPPTSLGCSPAPLSPDPSPFCDNRTHSSAALSGIIPKWLQKPPQLAPKLVLEPSWTPLGYGSFSRSLIFASTCPLGALLDASRPKKN